MGKVITVSVFDSETSKQINITNVTKGEVLVDIVGGNECAYFDEELEAFVQKDLSFEKVRKETVYDEDADKYEDLSVLTCSTNN